MSQKANYGVDAPTVVRNFFIAGPAVPPDTAAMKTVTNP